jgi:Ca2+:H+ antiporter
MVPCANLLGFTGQEFARKLPHVVGVLVETTYVLILTGFSYSASSSTNTLLLVRRYSLGSLVEIIMFMVLLNKNQFIVIQAAILGSILATMLLCLGLCFFAGGMRREESTMSEVMSETGNGLLLTA